MIPHNKPSLGQLEREAAVRALDSGWIAQGKEVEALENELCEVLGLVPGHAVAFSSGTAALFVALRVLNAEHKRVAIPVYSCAALRNAVLMAGGEPVLVDVGEDSPNIEVNQDLCQKVDMVVAAHMFGVPSRFRGAITTVPVIEDCAQAFGARIDGRIVGLNGAVGVFSFYATKMLTSGGQGGMLISSNRALVDEARDYRQFDCRTDRRARFNFQMTDFQAAVGRAQLSQLPRFVARRRAIFESYAAAGLPLWPHPDLADLEPCHYRAVLRVADPRSAIARFEENSIRTIVPIMERELLADAAAFPRAAALSRTTVSIPIYPALTETDVAAIIAAASRINWHGESKAL